MAWTYETGDGVFSSPAIGSDLISVGSRDNNIYRLGGVTATPTDTPTITPSPTNTPTPFPWPMFRYNAQHTGRSPY
ncbi:MAG: PQQ-binding-like beta-propeller repeat protein, partial [bacterium]